MRAKSFDLNLMGEEQMMNTSVVCNTKLWHKRLGELHQNEPREIYVDNQVAIQFLRILFYMAKQNTSRSKYITCKKRKDMVKSNLFIARLMSKLLMC